MDTELLRRWKIFVPLTDDELQNISYLSVYGDSSEQKAVLIDKNTDEVHVVGSDDLLPSKFKSSRLGSPASGGKVKIDGLCGQDLEKIVVGSSLWAGLDSSGKVLVRTFTEFEDENMIIFKNFESDKFCQISGCECGHHWFYRRRSVGGVELSVCTLDYDLFHTYTVASPPPSGTSVTKFVNSNACKMPCPKCYHRCSSARVGKYSLAYCKRCETFPKNYETENLIACEKYFDCCCVDIACGERFLALLTKSNDVIVSGIIKKEPCDSPVQNPDQIVIKTISCGSNHLAAVSSRGELYTCGWGASGQLGYSSNDFDITLRRVSLEGVVVKVCCGRSATTCLMQDGSVYSFGSNMKLSGNGSLLVNQLVTDVVFEPTMILAGKKFVDISYVPFTNEFFVQTRDGMVYSWGGESSNIAFLEIIRGASTLMEALIDRPITVSCVDLPSKETLAPSSLQDDLSELYGKTCLSDLVLKLSDGDFPVHGLVLFTKSAYFREYILKETHPLPKELDMTAYNPVAYRALLKYFYLLLPDELECSDLIDLYLLATSYKETDIIADSFERLKGKIGVDTVKLIRSKAKATGSKDLLEQCDLYIATPEFQAKLLERFTLNPDSTLSLLC